MITAKQLIESLKKLDPETRIMTLSVSDGMVAEDINCHFMTSEELEEDDDIYDEYHGTKTAFIEID